MLQRKAQEDYQNLSEKERNREPKYAHKDEKSRKPQYACQQYRKLFIEDELSERRKNGKHQNAHNLYNNLSKEKKKKGINILANNIEILL